MNGADQLLVIQNLAPDPAVDVRLNLQSGPLCGTLAAQVLYASAMASPSGAAPMVSSDGGLASFVPFDELPGRSTVVIRLSP